MMKLMIIIWQILDVKIGRYLGIGNAGEVILPWDIFAIIDDETDNNNNMTNLCSDK